MKIVSMIKPPLLAPGWISTCLSLKFSLKEDISANGGFTVRQSAQLDGFGVLNVAYKTRLKFFI